MRHFVDCYTNFLDTVRREKLPFDFFSLHTYAHLKTAMVQIRWVREQLDRYGFRDVGISLNEWLPEPGRGRCGTPHQAALVAAELAAFQNGPVTDAEIYDARCGASNYSPLFNCITRAPYKADYAYLAFNELRKLGTAAAVTGSADAPDAPEGLWACAARDSDGGRASLFVSNPTPIARPLGEVWDGRPVKRVRAVDAERDFTDIVPNGTIAADTLLLLEF